MKPLINDNYILEKYPGKGGWTYARIPELVKNENAKFGMVKVKGTIDGFAIKQYHLMPMGNGMLFLPVRAEIRKKIRKEAGAKVHVVLYLDQDELEIPEEFLICLRDEPIAERYFFKLSESEKKYYVQWIYSAKKEETKVSRMAKSIQRLSEGLKMYQQ